MVRAQIVLDESTAEQLKIASERGQASMSEIVRQALAFYFEHRKPDTSWIGSLAPRKHVSHDLADIRASVEKARKREAKR
ncbi:MAG: ribbon-helix-helix protein, CopG family [Polyangiaceae bacterium]|nr:ribbon-helix-helix protein, CopG family [Polyangiaceae bacterium]